MDQRWIHHNISASGDSRISFGADNKELNIANVSRADEGEYRCVANNSLGNASSNAAFLNVQRKYSLTLELTALNT